MLLAFCLFLFYCEDWSVCWYIGVISRSIGRNEEEGIMLILGAIILLVGAYLIYALF